MPIGRSCHFQSWGAHTLLAVLVSQRLLVTALACVSGFLMWSAAWTGRGLKSDRIEHPVGHLRRGGIRSLAESSRQRVRKLPIAGVDLWPTAADHERQLRRCTT